MLNYNHTVLLKRCGADRRRLICRHSSSIIWWTNYSGQRARAGSCSLRKVWCGCKEAQTQDGHYLWPDGWVYIFCCSVVDYEGKTAWAAFTYDDKWAWGSFKWTHRSVKHVICDNGRCAVSYSITFLSHVVNIIITCGHFSGGLIFLYLKRVRERKYI